MLSPTYHAGRLLANVELSMIFSSVQVQNSDGTFQSQAWLDYEGDPAFIVPSYNAVMRDLITGPYIALLGQEYSVPNGPQIGPGKLLSSALINLPVTVQASGLIYVAQYQEVEAMIDAAISTGRLPLPNSNSLYGVLAPNFRVQDPQGFVVGETSGGFHNTFKSKIGVSVAYFVVDASDSAGSNTVYYASHELAEAITDTELTGWLNDGGQEICDICQADPDEVRSTYHGFDISKFFLRSTGSCGAPKDDGLFSADPQLSIIPGIVESALGCVTSIPVNSVVDFKVTANADGVPDALTKIQWAAQGASIVGSDANVVCKIKTPADTASFRLLIITANDSFGYTQLATDQTFYCAPPETVAIEARLCAIKHIILKDWRLLNPIWSKSRDFSQNPGTEVEIRAINSLVVALTEFKDSLARLANG